MPRSLLGSQPQGSVVQAAPSVTVRVEHAVHFMELLYNEHYWRISVEANGTLTIKKMIGVNQWQTMAALSQ